MINTRITSQLFSVDVLSTTQGRGVGVGAGVKVLVASGVFVLVKLEIKDSGCGMDAETLKKATQPFFSAKPAGRNRGMGLAYAARFIQLNKGSLKIASEPGKGTAVTICLPRK